MCARLRNPAGRPLAHRSLKVAFVLLALVAAFTAPANAASCSLAVGLHVLLVADGTDPDVFLWDARTRLIDYASGHWGNTKAIFDHTLLVEPGTRAQVVACSPAAVRPKYTAVDEDVLGVKVLSGPFRGRYGWALSSDAHQLRDSRQGRF
jgi:hypothetical protein